MPAAAVIPAPIAYIKVVAVKKLVVGFWGEYILFEPGLPGWCVLARPPLTFQFATLLLLTEWSV